MEINDYIIDNKKYRVSDAEMLNYIVDKTGVTRTETVESMIEDNYINK